MVDLFIFPNNLDGPRLKSPVEMLPQYKKNWIIDIEQEMIRPHANENDNFGSINGPRAEFELNNIRLYFAYRLLLNSEASFIGLYQNENLLDTCRVCRIRISKSTVLMYCS